MILRSKLPHTAFVLGFDNGSSGSIGMIRVRINSKGRRTRENFYWQKIPCYHADLVPYRVGDSRTYYEVNHDELKRLIEAPILKEKERLPSDKIAIYAAVEQPMVNPGRFFNSIGAVMNHNTVTRVLEELMVDHSSMWENEPTIIVVPSSRWQKVMLPGVKGRDNLKKHSRELLRKLYHGELPSEQDKTWDGDGFLIAEWFRQRLDYCQFFLPETTNLDDYNELLVQIAKGDI